MTMPASNVLLSTRWSSRTLAIASMCAGVMLLTVSDALTKWLVSRYGPFQIVFVRNLTALPFVIAMVVWADGWRGLKSARPSVHFSRGLLTLGAAAAFITSLQTLPLAEAMALVAAAPLFIAALSAMVLGESVGRAQWATIAVGFVGVLIVTRPGAATFQPASLLALAATALYALLMVSAKWIDRRDGVRTFMFHLTLVAVLFSSFAVVTPWPQPQLTDAPLFLTMALAGTLGVTLLTQAFRLAPAAVVAPFDYTALVWAGVLGWLVWGETPDAATLIGAAIIIASGLYLVLTENRMPGLRLQPPYDGGAAYHWSKLAPSRR
jgi:drug/metabolite transporter (DMT)-like permease